MKKLITLIVLMTVVLQTCPVFAGTGLFFDYTTARRMASDMDYSKKKIENQNALLQNYSSTTTKLSGINTQLNMKITGLEKDKEIYKKEYNKCESALKDSPSRLTWFTTGVVATLFTVVAGFIYLKH